MPGTALVTIGENQWNVEVATTTTELAAGLSGRASIPAGTGMLFILPVTQVVTVTTAEMLFALDVIFIKYSIEGVPHVLDIAQNIEPGNLVEEATPIDMFLEVNTGEADLVEIGDAVEVEITTPPPSSGFDFGSIIAFAIPMVVLGFVSGMFFKRSAGKELSSSGHHSNQGRYTWQIINHAVGEKHESLVSYKDRTYTLSSAYNFIEDELKIGHPKPTERGYEIKIIDSKGKVVYTEWYIPSWMKQEWKQWERKLKEGYGEYRPGIPTEQVEQEIEAIPDWVRKKWLKEKMLGGHHSGPGIIIIPKLPEEARGDFLFYEYIRDLSKLRKESLTEEEAKELWEGWKEQRSGGHSIHGEPRQRLVDKYGSWAVGRAEAVCGEDDIACVTKEAKRLSETFKARYGGEGMEYVTIISPGQTVFHIGDVVSQVALEKENRRVRALGENEATFQKAAF